MSTIRFYALHDKLSAVEPIILLRVARKKAVAQNGLRRIVPLLIVQAVYASEIRDPAFRADAGTAEKDNVVAIADDLFQLFDLIVLRILIYLSFSEMLA